MMKEKNEMLGVMLCPSDKEAIKKEIATRNNVTMSFVARALIADSLKHISERNIFKMVVE